jgi:hypothetical protein
VVIAFVIVRRTQQIAQAMTMGKKAGKKDAKDKLTRKTMWARIEGLSGSLGAESIAKLVLPEIRDDETQKFAEAHLTERIRRWLLAKRKKDAPEQMTFFEREEGIGVYASLDDVPEPLLRKRSSKLRTWGEALIKIADAIDGHLAEAQRRQEG